MATGVYKRSEEVLERLRTWSKGRKFTEEHKAKISLSLKGKNHPQWGKVGKDTFAWKGKDAGYWGVHAWIKRHKGSPKECETCKRVGLNPKSYHWANKDHKYSRDVNDYMCLCARCHYKYDVEKGLRKPLRVALK